MSFTISDLIVETLEKSGVRRVYGLPGDSLNGFTDALRRNGSLVWEYVRHEEAAFAAAAEAAITQQAYAICSVAVDLKISQVVDVPNMLVSAFLPATGAGRTPPDKKPHRPLTAWRHRPPPEKEKGVQSWI